MVNWYLISHCLLLEQIADDAFEFMLVRLNAEGTKWV
jgi:hypothetical protein